MGAEPIIVDTNILFSALLSTESTFGRLLIRAGRDFFICETTLTELFRRKEKLVRGARMDEAELVMAYHLLLKRMQLFRESQVPEPCWTRARELCAGLDPDDAPQVAVTLALDGLLWTGDDVLKTGLRARGFDRFFTF
ncbi:MAG TPA: PIN domain-containing protein [Longimicrobium sp.]|nr:PIN domain-containing protein [Longimicrobium sp.]